MARPKKGPPSRAVTYRLPEDLLAQLDRLAEQTRRTLTAEVQLALEAHLATAGLWPVPGERQAELPPPKKGKK